MSEFYIFARKIYKIPEFFMIFAQILHDNFLKYFFSNFWGYLPPVSYAYIVLKYQNLLRVPLILTAHFAPEIETKIYRAHVAVQRPLYVSRLIVLWTT